LKGYIYITGQGADPAAHQDLNDPIFGKTPTLGACMPNIRWVVQLGDYIFAVSGKTPAIQQYVIGGMRVAEKIDALAAYRRFPQNRLRQNTDGRIWGNIIVTQKGRQHPLDHHSVESFEQRVRNFIVGDDSISLETEREVELGRGQSLAKLSSILDKRGNRVIDVMSRWAKLDEDHVRELLDWLRGIKTAAQRS
jgi:Nucleotide modification associated domain 2